LKERNLDSRKQESLHSGQKDNTRKKLLYKGLFTIAFLSKWWYNVNKLEKEEIGKLEKVFLTLGEKVSNIFNSFGWVKFIQRRV
jgi:hypothetical protein